MGLIKTILKQILKEGRVSGNEKISDSVYKISIQSEAVKSINFVPGYFLRIVIGITEDSLQREDAVRSYSVWNIDQTSGTMDIAIATHSQGAGAGWAARQREGDSVHFAWKKGKFLVDSSADSYLMIGDLSALSHLYMIRRNLPENKQVESIVYSQQLSELFADIDGRQPLDFYQMPQNPIIKIITQVNELIPKMKGKKMVYIAGDSRVCTALNRYFLKELNWGTKQIKVKPFWNPDKKGLE
ncbi:siderophore-interacting protein [Fulvivirga ulvae]|uniref:siderophore-interacting protein n=1 Tax=Fulvivirga ulvae TaxID=2904245 RepID=UPI001F4163F3|nr:siderophore-interacting protein [Fulvivirga ulvae]UII29598.1 siderophore-interacting protein [Fulvivirga ulvae]